MPRRDLRAVLSERASRDDASHDAARRLASRLDVLGLSVEHLGVTGAEFIDEHLDPVDRLPQRVIVRPRKPAVDWTTWDPKRARARP